MDLNFSDARSTRREVLSNSGKIRGGVLHPVAGIPVRPGESGLLSQEIYVELEPINGRLISDITCEVKCVFVPALAADALLNADLDHPGNAEIFRKRLLAGEDVFPMEAESDITKAMGIEPVKINNVLWTNSITRLAHNAAVNYLRLQKYHKATELVHGNATITPALYGSTALQRYNAVLTPDERINGAIDISQSIPVQGLAISNTGSPLPQNGVRETMNDPAAPPAPVETQDYADAWIVTPDGSGNNGLSRMVVEMDPSHPEARPNIRVEMNGHITLKDLMQAERQDELVRKFQMVMKRFPQYGEDMILHFIHNLKIETDKTPWTVFDSTVALTASLRPALDGPSMLDDVEVTRTSAVVPFTAMIPKNEFGGMLITFLAVKPEEVLSGVPHPVLSQPWKVDNHAADELVIDPVPVIARELDNTVTTILEDQVMFYVGNNHIQRQYLRSDWARDVDPNTVDHKSTRWRHEVPLSVSPDNILYPADLDHYPFVLNAPTDPVASFTSKAILELRSPTILGPTPIEQIDVVTNEGVFVDDPDVLQIPV